MNTRLYNVENTKKTDGTLASKVPSFNAERYAFKKYLNNVKTRVKAQTSHEIKTYQPTYIQIPQEKHSFFSKLVGLLNSLLCNQSTPEDWLHHTATLSLGLLKKENKTQLAELVVGLNIEQISHLLCKAPMIQNLCQGIYFFAKNTRPLSTITRANLELIETNLRHIAAALDSAANNKGLGSTPTQPSPVNSIKNINSDNRKAIQLYIYLNEKSRANQKRTRFTCTERSHSSYRSLKSGLTRKQKAS